MSKEVDVKNTILESKRLILRSWQKEDLEDLYQIFSDPAISKMSGCPIISNMQEAENLMKMFQDMNKVFALVWKENHKVIGSLDLETPQFDFGDTYKNAYGKDVGCILHKDYWGNNIMVEATDLVVAYCFQQLQCDYMCCGHFTDNPQSSRLIEKMGFHYQRDVIFHPQTGGEKAGKLYLLDRKEKEYENKS